MTTLEGRDRTALLVVDVQKGVVGDAYDRDAVVGRIVRLVERAREEGVDVVWVQHHDAELLRDTPEWEYVPELVPRQREPVVHKTHNDAFDETDLEARLAERRVGRLVVAGAQTDQCIRSTLHGAITRGHDALLVEDAHTTSDFTEYGAPPPELVIAHTNLYWRYHDASGRTAGTARSDEVDLAGRSGE